MSNKLINTTKDEIFSQLVNQQNWQKLFFVLKYNSLPFIVVLDMINSLVL